MAGEGDSFHWSAPEREVQGALWGKSSATIRPTIQLGRGLAFTNVVFQATWNAENQSARNRIQVT
ncbi:hypothetical protein C7T86_02970 [Xanthomonas citri pv. malvacearum]|uniref:Uncharacterized protein n=1 Tax=Xanthomonas campestris pv. malvacearum TaxID=86040 RepID=A0AA44Z3W6_XANCM|nr:hypothetical protein CIW71_18335 [Xanthomonas citri pv. malvacearum]ASY90818.1 hypothetical protein CIW72_05465 [Xanthomonas citri pv. malvacearum]NMI12983.1 hypothetical protein [Xanthomonas citri]PUE96112.1 hypothetical protein C7T86_02970 [Xanthomonas citri pv. malvacearum]